MADSDTLKPMTDGDVTPPPADTEFQPAAPLKEAGIGVDPAAGEPAAAKPVAAAVGQARQAARETLTGFGQQAGDQARTFADTGKEKVGGLLDQLAQMLNDAAGQVDERLGRQYGVHARNAASSVEGFAQAVRDKDIDEFADEVRGYVSKSPAVALGIAAALGFGLARVVHAGFDQRG